MNSAALAGEPVAKRRESGKKQSRFELRAEETWLERVERQAARFGLTTAAYIRQAVQIKLEADEATETHKKPEAPEKK